MRSLKLKCFCTISLFYLLAFKLIPIDEEKVDFIKNSSQEISSIDFRYPDDKDLNFLIDKIGNSRIVLIGENRHGDSSSACAAKLRITNFLVHKMGFEVLLEESPIIYSWKIYQSVLEGQSALFSDCLEHKNWSTENFYRGCIKSHLEFIDETKLVFNKKLIYGGFDCFDNANFIKLLEKYLNETNPEILQTAVWISYKNNYSIIVPQKDKINKNILNKFIESADSLIIYLREPLIT